ncbi:MAG: Organic solvent tolerance protein OstA [Cyclobacteriaceae bacterium]|nr:Organic solvent tolerance protein OstA [Cyclobacteriaceae bacterium]MCH8514739.1 Organic solvent tolerance protein OstA [Cyclobacteriaceae bacterium]
MHPLIVDKNINGNRLYMKLTLGILVFVFVGIGISMVATAQQGERVILEYGGDYMKNDSRNGMRFSKFISEDLAKQVKFTQKDTELYGDSVYHFRDRNVLEVYGRVKVYDGDSVTITGDRLYYDGNARLAQMFGNVEYSDGNMVLYTDKLDYDLNSSTAYYLTGGRLVDDRNVLVSKKGYYFAPIKYMTFKDDVVLTNPDMVLRADSLEYSTETQISYFVGPTEITSANGTVLNSKEGGKYDSRQEQSDFLVADIETPSYYIEGDFLFFDDAKGYYEAIGNVVMTAKEDDIIITGDRARHWDPTGITKVFGNPVMRRLIQMDTLFMSADTLISVDDELDAKKHLLGFRDVRIFKTDLQGISDSIAYHFLDSTIHMYYDPVIWNIENQITSDTIRIFNKNNTIDKMELRQRAFLVQEDTLKNFNQIKGRNMDAYFKEGFVDYVDVLGNSEGIYFMLEEEQYLVGMNKFICSDMKIIFKDGEIFDITLYKNPDATLTPPHELKEPETRLKDFKWRDDERPTKEFVVNRDPDRSRPQVPSRMRDNVSLPNKQVFMEGSKQNSDSPSKGDKNATDPRPSIEERPEIRSFPETNESGSKEEDKISNQ